MAFAVFLFFLFCFFFDKFILGLNVNTEPTGQGKREVFKGIITYEVQKMKQKILLVISGMFMIANFLAESVSAGEFRGQRQIQNYEARLYDAHPQNWDIVQDSKGLIYVANNYGLLEFDGREWTIFPSEPGRSVRSLDIDHNDRIYYGASGCFGFMEPDGNGRLVYHSLLPLLPESERVVRTIMDTKIAGDKVYFRSSDRLFIYHNNTVDILQAQSTFHRTYYTNQNFFAHKPGMGLFRLENDSLILMPGGDVFEDVLIYLFLHWHDDTYLVGTNDNQLFLYDTGDAAAQEGDFLTPFDNEAFAFLKHNAIYTGVWVDEESFAVGTMRGGAVVLNRKGELLEVVDKNAGLQDESVWGILPDRNNKLWLALNNGISLKELDHPMMFWDENDGIEGVVQELIFFNSRLYAATMLGVYFLQNDRFVPVRGIQEIAWRFARRMVDGREELFVGTRNGIYQIVGDRALLIYRGATVRSLYFDERFPDILFGGTNNGLLILRQQEGRWMNLGFARGLEGMYIRMFIDEYEDLWLEGSRGIEQVVLNRQNLTEPLQVNRYYSDDDPVFSGMSLYPFQDFLLFVSNKGIFRFNRETEDFELWCILGEEFCMENITLGPIVEMSNGELWLYKRNYFSYSRELHVFEKDEKGNWQQKPLPCTCFPNLPVYSIIENSTGVWFGGSSGVYYYDNSYQREGEQLPEVLLKRVVTANDSIYLHRLKDYRSGINGMSIPFGKNHIAFDFAIPSYSRKQEGFLFSSFLEGYDDDWTEFSPGYSRVYTNLPPGKYEFKIKVLLPGGDEVYSAPFGFRVERPWFLRWYAYVLYLVFIALVIVLVNRIYTFSLRRKNEGLQKTINERTAEIVHKSHEIQRKNEVLEQQKEEILSQSHQLENINKSLEDKIVDELSKSRKKDLMLIQQSRQAAMGEMIGNIAHQWRQPLNAVGVIIQNLQEAYDYEELNKEYLNDRVQKSMEIIQYMSQTIDDFRNFFKPEKSIQPFNVKQVVEKCISFVEATLKRNDIRLTFHATEDIFVQGYSNEYAQVVLNLLNNSKDIILERKINSPFIEVNLFQKEGVSYLYVTDNAGGIHESIREKIFTPYFTTKEPGEGTGLGLYMSKTIIEKNMGGSLTFENTADGVEFIVKL